MTLALKGESWKHLQNGRALRLAKAVSAVALLLGSVGGVAHAFEGIVVSDLPKGGDVTVPGRYPIHIPPQMEVLLSGMQTPQAVTLSNKGSQTSQVQIYAQHETQSRTINIRPGTSTVYNFKKLRPIRVRVLTGKVEASSLDPVKIQR